jgi:hypothetical protein
MRLRSSGVAMRFFVLFLLIAGFGSSTARAAGVVSVCDQAHLQAALNGGGLVTFSTSCDIKLASTVTISSNTSIDVSGHSLTLDGQNSVQVLTVNSGVTLVLNNLTIANGKSSFDGGGIENSGTLIVTNSTFSGNSTPQNIGGGIYNEGTALVTNTTFSGNSAPIGQGGAIYNFGSLVVTNSTFSGNSDEFGGGALANAATAQVTNTTFSHNSTQGLGGAIYNTGSLTVTSSTLAGNTAPTTAGYGGGGIYNNFEQTTLENTIIVGSGASGKDCLVGDGTITDHGYNLDDDGTCGLSSANHSLSNDHNANLGPLASNGGLTQTFALESGSDAIAKIPPGVNGCATTVPNDQRGVSRPQNADGYCSMGAYEAYNTTNSSTITNCSNDGQLRTALGIAGRIIFECGGTITLTQPLTTLGPTLIDGNGHNVTLSGGNNLPVIINGSTLILNGLTIANGSESFGDGGGAANAGTMIVTNSTFANNHADNAGGALFSTGILLIVTNSTFSGNSAPGPAAIYSDSGSGNPVIVTGSTFSGHSLTAGTNDSVIYAQSGTVTFQNSLIAGNTLNIGSNCAALSGVFTDLGYNLDDDGSCGFSSANGSLSNNNGANPGSLSSNGGPTQTVPLTYPSTALDAIPITASACGVSPDQRAVLRPQGFACDIGAFEAKEIPVPFSTNPANLSYTVGSSTYTSAKAPFLVVGGEYPLSTTSPQSGGTGTQYVWENWSDNGGIEHTITIPSTPVSYTANFNTQYYLTMNVNPSNGGTVSPGSSWQDANAVVDISASQSSGFQFSSWTGSAVANASSASTTITMSGPESVTANFVEPPAITSANNTTFSVGAPGTFTVTTNGYPTVTSISDGGATLPGNVTFHNNGDGTATLSGTPQAGTGGAYTFTITASNGVAPAATQQFTLYVDQPPAITSANNVTFIAGTPGSFTVTTTGYPAPSISDGGFSLPSGLTFHDNGNGTATLSGTPASNTGGVYTFTITASNGVSPNATQLFTLTIDQAPAVTSSNNISFYVGVSSSFTVTATGYPTPRLTSSEFLPGGVYFIDNGNGTGTIYGTPTAAGTFPGTIIASNSVGHATQDFTLYVDASISISPSSLNFGSVLLNSKHSLTAVLTNKSASAITISGVSIVPGTANATTYVYAGNCVGKLKAGASCNLTVNLTANALGTLTATLDVTDGVAGSPQTIPLTAGVSP